MVFGIFAIQEASAYQSVTQFTVTVQVVSSCEAAGLCGMADVHELSEPGHVRTGLPHASAGASVAQLPATADQAAGSRIDVHELTEPGHVPAILPGAPVQVASAGKAADRQIAVRDRQVAVDF